MKREFRILENKKYSKGRMYQPLIQPWSRINVTSGLNIYKMARKTELKRDLSHFSSFNITSYLICIDLISSCLIKDSLILNQRWLMNTELRRPFGGVLLTTVCARVTTKLKLLFDRENVSWIQVFKIG